MTALKAYERLECTGLWRSGPAMQRREVVVSCGQATLILTDMQNRPLAHWSLAAIDVQTRKEDAATLRPAPGSEESLEISDKTMLEALQKVQKAIDRSRPHPGRLRFILAVSSVVLLSFVTLIWGPQAMVSYASNVLPEAKRAQLGRALVERIGQLAGPYCTSPEGIRSAALLVERLAPKAALELRVLPGQRTAPIVLPGGKVILFDNMVGQSDDPAVTAAYVAAAIATLNDADPLGFYLEDAGPFVSISLITSNELSNRQLDQLAKIALSDQRRPASAAQPPASTALPALPDGAWLGLQAICNPG
ncbi:MAG: hypothetical protein ISP37_08495 [Planktomarina sp.]|uniref:hypothetical protein n=1 Tax=Planktomarina sp. TaxID=2024851 RepID=UPI00326160B8|nr:hypothetical protein [Planktomarina sp.]